MKYKYSRKRAIELIRRDWNFEIMKNVLLATSDPGGSSTKRKRDATTGSTAKVRPCKYCGSENGHKSNCSLLNPPQPKKIEKLDIEKQKSYQQGINEVVDEMLEIVIFNQDKMSGMYDYNGIVQDIFKLLKTREIKI